MTAGRSRLSTEGVRRRLDLGAGRSLFDGGGALPKQPITSAMGMRTGSEIGLLPPECRTVGRARRLWMGCLIREGCGTGWGSKW